MQDDTVHAAAVVLAAAARSTTGLLPHHQRAVVDATKTRWWSRLRAKLLCFRPSHSHPRRVADASPEPVHSTSSTNSHFTHHATRPAVAFVAPPSSPASSLLASSESPSPVQVLLRLDASCYSSPTASIFAVGPYAREPQQLVSPPAFSAGLTEPSTAPLTPPPESGCCLQPGSSPEVPFARFLSPSFQTYRLQPGSPTLVSPPTAWMHRHSEEGSPPSGEFVFGRAAGEWSTSAADGEHGGRRSSCGSVADDVAEDGGNQHWPFRSSFPK